MSGVFSETQASGDYTIEVTASGGGAGQGSTKSRFLVFEQDLELDNAAADPSLLSSLARMTAQAGGQLLAPKSCRRWSNDLRTSRSIWKLAPTKSKATGTRGRFF